MPRHLVYKTHGVAENKLSLSKHVHVLISRTSEYFTLLGKGDFAHMISMSYIILNMITRIHIKMQARKPARSRRYDGNSKRFQQFEEGATSQRVQVTTVRKKQKGNSFSLDASKNIIALLTPELQPHKSHLRLLTSRL